MSGVPEPTDTLKILNAYIKHANPTYAPDPRHTCTNQCKFWQYPDRRLLVSVCIQSLQVHQCGEYCQHGIKTYDMEYEVCGLTGLVLERDDLIYHPTRSRVDGVVASQTHCFRPNKPYVSTKNNHSVLYTNMLETLTVLFIHEHRAEEERRQRIRLGTLAKNIVRANRKNHRIIVAKVWECVYKNIKYFTTIPNASDPMFPILATALCQHWELLQPALMCVPSLKNLHAFVCSVIRKLCDGMEVSGIIIYPKVPWVVKHAPPRTLYTVLCKPPIYQTNDAIHKMWHHIQRIITNNDGVPLAKYTLLLIPLYTLPDT